jgi:hypothetical protein
LNIGSTTFVAKSAKYFCCTILATKVPGFSKLPALELSPGVSLREGAITGRPAVFSASCISCDSGMPCLLPVESSMVMVATPVRVIKHQYRSELADRRGAEALTASCEQDCVLVDEVAGKVRVDIAEDQIVLDERGHASTGRWHRIGGVDRIAKGAGVAEKMSGRHSGGIGHREGREQCVRVGEIDAFIPHGGKRGRGLRCHGIGSEAIGDEQNEVALALRGRRYNLQKDGDARGGENHRTK